MSKLSLQEQAVAIKKAAEDKGLETNYFFVTAFERYETQIGVLSKLKSVIDSSETLVSKEYVKGRENLYTHPAITEYNKTTDSANKTVSTLLRILKSCDTSADDDKGRDPLMSIINGGDGDDDSDRV